MRRLEEQCIHPTLRPPRTRMPVSVRDAALWAPDVDRALAVLAEAVQQRLVTVPQLRQALLVVRRHAYRKILALALDDIEGGSHSLVEIDVVRICRRAGLPVPNRQAVRTDSPGRRRWLDLDWDAYQLAGEVEAACTYWHESGGPTWTGRTSWSSRASEPCSVSRPWSCGCTASASSIRWAERLSAAAGAHHTHYVRIPRRPDAAVF